MVFCGRTEICAAYELGMIIVIRRSRFSLTPGLMQYVTNSAWMLAEYALRVISAIFITIYVARYLGPERFGILSYALALNAVFSAVSRLGMESILVRDLVGNHSKAGEYMGTAFWLMLISSLINFSILSIGIYGFEKEGLTRFYVWIIALSIIVQPLLVADYNFQAQVRAKLSAISKSSALIITSILKLLLVWYEANLVFIVVAFLLDFVMTGAMLIFMHIYTKQPAFIFKFNREYVRPLLSSAWPMVLSSVSIILYMRVDQIMIKNMIGSYQLGLYAAATRVYEGWLMMSVVIAISLLPAIVKLKTNHPKRYEEGLSKVFALLFWAGVAAAILSTILGSRLIVLVFGEKFSDVSSVFTVIMWSAGFAAFGSLSSRYLTVEGLERKIASRSFVALAVNIALNFALIPHFGIEGAAIATLIAIIISNYLINFTDKELNQLARICNNALLFRFSYENTRYENKC